MPSLFDRLDGSEPAEFPSDFTRADSVQRLAEAVNARLFVVGGAPQVRGSAMERYVSIRRVEPGVHGAFRPVFTGAFHEHDGRVVLRGAYSLDDATKLVASAFLAACLGVAFILAKARHDPAIAVESLGHLRRYLEEQLEATKKPRRRKSHVE